MRYSSNVKLTDESLIKHLINSENLTLTHGAVPGKGNIKYSASGIQYIKYALTTDGSSRVNSSSQC